MVNHDPEGSYKEVAEPEFKAEGFVMCPKEARGLLLWREPLGPGGLGDHHRAGGAQEAAPQRG